MGKSWCLSLFPFDVLISIITFDQNSFNLAFFACWELFTSTYTSIKQLSCSYWRILIILPHCRHIRLRNILIRHNTRIHSFRLYFQIISEKNIQNSNNCYSFTGKCFLFQVFQVFKMWEFPRFPVCAKRLAVRLTGLKQMIIQLILDNYIK